MLTARLRALLAAGVLLSGLVLLGSTPVRAQITAEPEALSVALRQGEQAERTLTLTNTGSEVVAFCLSFERPLQRANEAKSLDAQTVETACGEIGEILYQVGSKTAAIIDPFGLGMTPDGRLFASDFGGQRRTVELTPELEVVRSFRQPVVEQVSPTALTQGVTYNADTGTLWWLNIEQAGFDFRRALLLEGTLEGVATGRRIEIAPLTNGDPPVEIVPSRLSYDPAAHRYYVTGFAEMDGSTLWAIDTLGVVVDGYPVRQTAYPNEPTTALDAHGGASGEPEAVRLEVSTAAPSSSQTDRLAVVDPLGNDLGIETPLPDVSGGTQFGSITGEPLRSRTDPNGVLYFPFVNFDERGVVGIRPHPLPPSWLALSATDGSAWDGELGPGESAEITLTFSAGTRSVGNTYSAMFQVFEAASGTALEVPLAFEIAEGTPGEEEPVVPAASLSVYPNPAADRATVALNLSTRSTVRLSVYDVLGREVAVLHDGPLAAGTHALSLGTVGLPSGVYLVRAVGDAFVASQRLTLQR